MLVLRHVHVKYQEVGYSYLQATENVAVFSKQAFDLMNVILLVKGIKSAVPVAERASPPTWLQMESTQSICTSTLNSSPGNNIPF